MTIHRYVIPPHTRLLSFTHTHTPPSHHFDVSDETLIHFSMGGLSDKLSDEFRSPNFSPVGIEVYVIDVWLFI